MTSKPPVPKISPPPVDSLVDSAVRSLSFRNRAFLLLTGALLICLVVHLASDGGMPGRLAVSLTGWIVGFGVPWLGWHLRVPFAARVAGPLLYLFGFDLQGEDPRGTLWVLVELPILAFLVGWGLDLCLRQEGRFRGLVGRCLFSLVWIYLGNGTLQGIEGKPELWFDLIGMFCGLVALWMPREALIPAPFRTEREVAQIVARGMRSAWGWILTRLGIAVLILLPSIIYLDLLDLPPLLRSEWKKCFPASETDPAKEAERRLLFWKRETRALTEERFGILEVFAADREATGAVVAAIEGLRRAPRDPAALERFTPIGAKRLGCLVELEAELGKRTVFYVDRSGSGDDRVTSGLFDADGTRWSGRGELSALSLSDIDRLERSVEHSTLVILAGGILVIMLLGGPSGGVPPAWWIAIFLAGTHFGWAGESFELVVERVPFVIWRDFADHHAGATLMGLHTLLLFFVRTANWMTENLVAHAGVWVSLCWPSRPGPLLRSVLDRFWLQAGKILLVASILYGVRLVFALLGTTVAVEFRLAWFLLSPPALILAGLWMRRRVRARSGVGASGYPVAKLPNLGKVAVAALLLRAWVAFFSNLELSGWLSGEPAHWAGVFSVLLAIVAALLLVVSLERGGFLSPPHIEGQLWLIGVASLPFVENVVSDPVSGWIERSNLFLGTTVGWLAFAASLWVIGPIFGWFEGILSRWRARGLEEIETFHSGLFDRSKCGAGSCPVAATELCSGLFGQVGIENPQLWRHLGSGVFRREVPKSGGESFKLVSNAFASALGGVEGSLRLEEMRLEWRWAPFHGELDRWFAEGGDLLLIPASHEGDLLGVFCAPDVPGNRFLLRPAVSLALGASLATALLVAAPAEEPGGQAEVAADPGVA